MRCLSTSRFAEVSPYTTSRATATGQYSKRTHRKIAEFDSETKKMLMEIESRQKSERQDLHNEWICTHGSETKRDNTAMMIRATEARSQALHDGAILETQRKKRFSNLSKKHDQEMQTFIKDRNHERNQIISEMSVTSAPAVTPRCLTSTTTSLGETRKSAASFRISRHRLITNDTVRVGFFPAAKKDTLRRRQRDNGDGDLLDPDNLDRVLDKRDTRHARYQRDAEFARQFDDF